MKNCKTCKFRDEHRICTSHKLVEKGEDVNNLNDDMLVYFYNESGAFIVGDNFGCVHWKRKTR